ncbi:MAG: glycosyltransferase family 2 protein [Planctomycetes bacterium]|nr:glycosyltransferase family 2 protein [Planctomycetota bacterium]
MRVAAVVLNWNGGDENLACVESLYAQGSAVERVIFVDNGSCDGSWERVVARFPSVELLRNARNQGFGGGNNVGIAAALAHGVDAVLVVNNDVVVQPGTVARLVQELERHPEVGIVGPRVLYRENPQRVWAAGGMLTWRQNLTTLLGFDELDGPRWRETRDVDYVIGCTMLIRGALLEKCGGFDADYFAYTEDVDFCLKGLRAGWRSRVVGEVASLHSVSSATGGGYNPRRKYMMGVNSVWFLRRYAGPVEWLKFLVFDVATLPVLWLVGLFRGRSRAVLAKALGIFDGFRKKRVTAELLQPGANWLW